MNQKMRWRELFIPDYLAGTITWRLRPRTDFSCERGFNVFNSRHAGKIPVIRLN